MRKFPRVDTWRAGDLRLMGIIWLAIGLAVLPNHALQPDLVFTRFPVWLRLSIWCVPGVVSIVAAYRVRWQDQAFGLLLIPPAERALGYLVGWVLYGREDRIGGLVVYGLVMALVLRMARRPEPTHTPLPEPLEPHPHPEHPHPEGGPA